MFSKIGGALVLMTTMLGGCAVWSGTPARNVSYDYSDRAFYDHPYATSPVYTENFVQNVKATSDPADDQTAPALAKTAPEEKTEGAGIDVQPGVAAPPPVSAPPTRQPSRGGVVPEQSTSPGPARGGQSSSSQPAHR